MIVLSDGVYPEAANRVATFVAAWFRPRSVVIQSMRFIGLDALRRGEGYSGDFISGIHPGPGCGKGDRVPLQAWLAPPVPAGIIRLFF